MRPLRLAAALLVAALLALTGLGPAASADDGLLELGLAPAAHRSRDLARIGARAEHLQRGGAMAGRIGVDPDPAVRGAIIAADGVPRIGQLPSDRTE